MALMLTIDPTKQAQLREKLESLKQQQDKVRDECENMSSTICTILKNPPNTPSNPTQAPAEPPGLICNMLPPPPPPTHAQNDGPVLPPTPASSLVQRLAPPHLEALNSSELTAQTNKRPRKTAPIRRQCLMSTRSTLLVTSQMELDMDDSNGTLANKEAIVVSKMTQPTTTLTDVRTHGDSAV